MQDSRPRVAIVRWEWLLGSETFIRRQCDSLTSVVAVPLGAVEVASPLVRPGDRIVHRSTWARRVGARVQRITGRSRTFRRILRRERVDLVHAHFGTDAAIVAADTRRAGVPLVVTLHGYDVTRAPREPGWRAVQYRRRMPAMFARADRIIAVSQAIADHAVRLGAPPDKVVVQYIGIPVLPEQPARAPEWDILLVGRLVEKKGADDLVRAIGILRRRGRSVRCAIVGEGPLGGVLRGLAAESGAPVEFLGRRSPEETRELIRASRVVAVPSRTARDGDAEGLPTVVMEAMESGVPVVATRHSGIPEIVVDGGTGLLVDEADPAALADALERVLDDAEMRARFGAAGRARVEAHFDMGRQTERLEAIYRAVLAAQVETRTQST